MFKFIETMDGSPSLRLSSGEAETESMHSLKGAFAETVYIYGTAMETGFKEGFSPRVLSLGLGLGYVEILAAALALKHKQSQLSGESFEIVPELREHFQNWVLGKGEVPLEFKSAYELVLQKAAQETGIDGPAIRSSLAAHLIEKRWLIREALTAETQFSQPFGCICFDAFSSKTTPELWSEEFLVSFFSKAAAPGCILSTYACTGALKRSLKASGFDVSIRQGFSSKRDSTFAIRAICRMEKV